MVLVKNFLMYYLILPITLLVRNLHHYPQKVKQICIRYFTNDWERAISSIKLGPVKIIRI